MGTNYNPKVVSNGLLLYVDAANTKSYSGSGAAWKDLSGISGDITLTNSPTYSATDGRGSFSFNGSNQAGSSSYDFDNRFSAGITMSAWVKIPNYSTWHRIMTISSSDNTSFTYFLQSNASNGTVQFGTGVGGYTSGTTAMGQNTWVNVCATCIYGASGIKIYVNGVDNTGSTSGTPAEVTNVGTFYIARLIGSGGEYGNITLSNAMMYNRALTAAEVLTNFTALRGRFSI